MPLAIALNIIKKKRIKINKDKYDICLISDGFTLRLDNYYKIPGWEKNSALFLKSMINIIKKNKLKFIFCTKRIISINKDEDTFYKKYLTKDEINFLYSNSTIRNIREVVSPSYIKIQESKLSIGIWSTLLRENLQIGGKSLVVSTDPLKIYKYPINSNICNINFSSQKKLEKKILKLIKMSKKKYFSYFGKKKNFYIYPDYQNTLIELKKEISQYIY